MDCLLLLIQMLVSSLCDGVEEAVTLDGAPAVVAICEYRETLEAELGHTAPAHHLVALLALRSLSGQILLADAYLALRALLCPCAAHPLHEASI